MLDDLPREEVFGVIDAAVAELLAKASIAAPPVDAIALAQKHLGMVICLDRKQEQRGRAQRAAGLRQIYLRPEPSEERHQWTVAHEIGEHLKAGLLHKLGIGPGETPAMAGESLANLFAHRLLVPSRWFAEDAPALDYDLLELKRKYRTASHEVIAWRLLDLPEPCVVTIVDNDRISKRRSNAWRVRARQMFAAEQLCQRRVRETSQPQSVRKGEWSVRGWPVHRDDWKREILRSVRDGDC